MRFRFRLVIITVSTLITVAILGCWVRSYWFINFLVWHPPEIVDGQWHTTLCAVSTFHGAAKMYLTRSRHNIRADSVGVSTESETNKPHDWKKGRVRLTDQSAKGLDVNQLYYYAADKPHWCGFQVTVYAQHGFEWDQVTHGVMAPFWILGFVSAAPIVLLIRKPLRERRRRQHGQCVTCGYDLRATPDRCPECGNPVPLGHKPSIPPPGT